MSRFWKSCTIALNVHQRTIVLCDDGNQADGDDRRPGLAQVQRVGADHFRIRRMGMAGVQRMPSLKHWFMDEARGVSGDAPALLRG